ncbi:MAG: sugar-transfer associated ATP-grasp domain-containing protein [bacterium]
MKPPSIFKNIISTGLPDIRIIVYKNIPVMAMIRFPSFISNGCANLHKGGIGVGINLNTGYTQFGFYENKKITVHPDTNKIFANLQIPNWQEIINLAIESCKIVDINYLGVDIVLDENEKPLIMELNARPGLSIQMANFAGLVPLLKNI